MASVVGAVVALVVVCSLLAAAIAGTFGGPGDQTPREPTEEAADGAYEEGLRGAIAADPEDAAAMASLANLLAGGGRGAEALDWYERAIRVRPDDATTRLDFGSALAEAELRADAEEQFRRALAIDPARHEAFYSLGEVYRAWDPPRTDEAIEAYRRVIELAPSTYLAERSADELARVGAATPVPATGAVGGGSPAAPAGG